MHNSLFEFFCTYFLGFECHTLLPAFFCSLLNFFWYFPSIDHISLFSISYIYHWYWTVWYHVGGSHVLEVICSWYLYIILLSLDKLALSTCLLVNPIMFSYTVVKTLEFYVVYVVLTTYSPGLFLLNFMILLLVWTSKALSWCES